ncbi:Sm-like ribonucleoproteins family [Trichomonas vaginalis G3]|uniref:Sm-like ribonucleoproteins family n=1 Tax=Trichomonas vaginalis (strain ATCC PRA-98 / G3) TaxID=412133 RepID=UPI0021E55453|nr:Sm-like ribonucleoproteins family [Trichomonas vaginalis G3]KAI5525322.1 Sm-like ribonucleoproteins family [Trichomonas vaginalis G3]
MFPSSYLDSSVGKFLTATLKDGTIVSGTLISTDKFQNLVLASARIDFNNEEKDTETTCIRGNSIKYIILPKEISDVVREKRDAEKSEQQKRQQSEYNQNREYHNDGRNRGGYNRGGRGGNRGGRGGYHKQYQNRQNQQDQ